MNIRPSSEEVKKTLPGDTLLDDCKMSITYGIDIDAPPSKVFPWLLQMGCHRAGWYSYDLLDNAGKASAEVIVPEWQGLKIGDHMAGSPNDPPGKGFLVKLIEPEEALVLTTKNLLPSLREVEEDESIEGPYWQTTWQFFLQAREGNTTRLLVRNRLAFSPEWLKLLVYTIGGPAHYLMQRKQLHEIKHRAEALYEPLAKAS